MATATLPQGNEAILLSNQARDALDVGDYELAIRLIERISDLPEALVPVSGGRTFYPTWREALRLQAALPDEATRQFQLEFDAKVRGRRDAAIAANDLTALQELFQRFQASTLWPQVGEALVARYLDAGRYYDAVAVLRLLQSGQQQSRLLATQSVIALAAVGARTEAETRLGQYAGSNSGAALIGGEERDTLATWIANRISRTSTDTLPATFSIADAGLFHWTTLIDPARERAASQDRDAQLADAVDYLRRLPLIQPTICEEQLIIRSRGRISAFDTLSLLPRWSIVERQGTAGELQGSPEDWISQDAKRLVAHPLAHSLTSAFGLVFTVESLSVDSRSDEQFGWTGIRSGFGINTLVARDPQTGEVAWELGADQHSPIFQVAFQDDPVAVGDSLCVVYRRQDDLEMARIDPYTGSVLGKINLIGPPTFFSSRGGRCTVAADDSTVYVSTGNGVLAAVDGRTLTWRWATKYPSLLTSLRGRRWWNRAQSPPEFGMQRPVIAEGLVIFAPADAEEIVAVDRFSGRVRWQIVNRAAYQGIVGMVDAGLVLVGHVVTCLSIEDGQRVVWRSVPVEIVGRPLIDGERIYVPTREAVLGLRAKNGKAIEISTTATSKAVRSLALSADDA
ncbi:MAG: PQQ-binding-like beta-propeller repeat protein, partial [Phycisphaerae bacterium]